MKHRQVYVAKDILQAKEVLQQARQLGLTNDNFSLVARSDIELEHIPDRQKEADTDFVPAALRGMGLGAGTTVLAGLVAAVVSPIGLTVAGVGILALTGAAIGGWASALMGAALPDPVRQKFDDLISEGKILVVIDAEAEPLERLRSQLGSLGLAPLDYTEVLPLS